MVLTHWQLNKPIPEDLIPILAKDEEKQKAILEKAKADVEASSKASPGGSSSAVNGARPSVAKDIPAAAKPASAKPATPTVSTSAGEASKKAKTSMFIQPIPPFDKSKIRPRPSASVSGTPATINAMTTGTPTSAGSSATPTPAATGAPVSPTSSHATSNANANNVGLRLNPNASAFRPNPTAPAFKPVRSFEAFDINRFFIFDLSPDVTCRSFAESQGRERSGENLACEHNPSLTLFPPRHLPQLPADLTRSPPTPLPRTRSLVHVYLQRKVLPCTLRTTLIHSDMPRSLRLPQFVSIQTSFVVHRTYDYPCCTASMWQYSGKRFASMFPSIPPSQPHHPQVMSGVVQGVAAPSAPPPYEEDPAVANQAAVRQQQQQQQQHPQQPQYPIMYYPQQYPYAAPVRP